MCEFLYADDAALCACSSTRLQELLDGFSAACSKFGLTISLKKTVVMSLSVDHTFSVNNTALTVFGKLENRVWRNRLFTTKTKVCVYEACVLI